jgi:hypothetical protein
MNEEGHRRALEELRSSRSRLDPVVDGRLYAEATHRMALHAVAIGIWRRQGVDYDQHQGMTRRLRELGHVEIAAAFDELERIRMGRWYGRQGNGDAANHSDELLARIEEWALG